MHSAPTNQPSSAMAPFALMAGLDLPHAAAQWRAQGRVQLRGILEPAAALRLHDCLVTRVPWSRVLNDAGKHFDLGAGAWEAMPEPARRDILQRIHLNGRTGFQYFYDNLPLSDLRDTGQPLDETLSQLLAFLESAPFMNFARAVTGIATLATIDAQATCYRAGDFLTRHDDHNEAKRRRVAYVLNLTPQWRADWGGILQFLDRDGHVLAGYTPSFNALNLFSVPQPHCVSYVTPYAAASRYSITGWLRDA